MKKSDYHILQIVAAPPGWRAFFEGDVIGWSEAIPLFALVEVDKGYGRDPTRKVIALVHGDDGSDQGGFVDVQDEFFRRIEYLPDWKGLDEDDDREVKK